MSRKLPNEGELSELNTLLKKKTMLKARAEAKGCVKLNVELGEGPRKRLSL